MKYREISFNVKFDAIVCLDAVLPGKEFFGLFGRLPILAADGASLQLFKMGLMPDFIVGDLDTFSRSPLSDCFTGCTIIRKAEQETNDFEKTLDFARKNNFNNILVTGFHGGLLEHTLNNWSVFSRFSKIMNLCIYDSGRYGFSVSDSVLLHVRKGEIVSLVPQTRALVRTEGLNWELNNEYLEIGSREGARNFALSSRVRISVSEGALIVFCDPRLPYSPLD